MLISHEVLGNISFNNFPTLDRDHDLEPIVTHAQHTISNRQQLTSQHQQLIIDRQKISIELSSLTQSTTIPTDHSADLAVLNNHLTEHQTQLQSLLIDIPFGYTSWIDVDILITQKLNE